METLCGATPSKSSVPAACAELDAAVEEFRTRPVTGEYLFVMADATYLKAREDHRVVSKALMIAIGLTAEGRKEVIGFGLADTESEETWTDFLSSLRGRGLRGMRMLTSDAHDGLVAALHAVWPDVAWQRCQAHFARNVVDAAPKRLREGLRSGAGRDVQLRERSGGARTQGRDGRRLRGRRPEGQGVPRRGVRRRHDRDGAARAGMRRCTRTSNYLERLNKEVKRRSKVIGIFPNAASTVRLMGSFLIEENDRWAAARKEYYRPAVRELEERARGLALIARNQRQMRKAA